VDSAHKPEILHAGGRVPCYRWNQWLLHGATAPTQAG